MAKTDIRQLSKNELIEVLKKYNEKPFRSKQIYEWLWKKSASTFDEMSNLSQDLRNKLNCDFEINPVAIKDYQKSSDRTIKNEFILHDNKIVEGVLIPSTDRVTACISSQVGCSLSCAFCATGKLERLRNLNADEIYDQVVLLKRQAEEQYSQALTNIVYMGMGEPLLNYNNVLTSIEKITSPEGLNISPQRITLSTAGIAKMIKKLGDDKVKFNLALSLHAANDELRNKIMPINEQNSLSSLADALNYFYDKTGTRCTLEFIVFKDFNDSIQDAADLVSFCKKITCKVNIIEYNPIEGGEFQQTTPQRLEAFKNYLESHNVIVNIRRSRGKDIDAACGQLANKNNVLKKSNIN